MTVAQQIQAILTRPHRPSECPSKGMFGVDCKNCVRPRKVYPPMITHVQRVMFAESDIPGVKIRDLKPKARKHHKYEITFPEQTTHTYKPSTRLGHYGHDEYLLPEPEGDRITVTIEFQERTAWYRPQRDAHAQQSV